MRTLAFLEIREWHFRDPVFFGDTIRVQRRGGAQGGCAAAAGAARSPGGGRIINQEGKVVQEGVVVTLVEGRGQIGAAAIGKEDPDGTDRP